MVSTTLSLQLPSAVIPMPRTLSQDVPGLTYRLIMYPDLVTLLNHPLWQLHRLVVSLTVSVLRSF